MTLCGNWNHTIIPCFTDENKTLPTQPNKISLIAETNAADFKEK